jgi:phage baseplate assembly protein gpV
MDEVLARIAREFQRRTYGKYRGFVADNDDPQQLGRIRAVVPSVLGAEVTGWALPCLPFGGQQDQGLFAVPEVDAQVWVEFEEGDVSRPIWTGTFWRQAADVPAEAATSPPTTRLLKTPSGHLLRFDDEDGAERVTLHHQGGAELDLDPDGRVALTASDGGTLLLDAAAGSVTVEDANGNRLVMEAAGVTVEDASGNRIELAGSGVVVSGTRVVLKGSQVLLGGEGGEPVIKGQSFLTLFATHVHPTGVGPSGPPVPQGEMTTLSTTVLTS